MSSRTGKLAFVFPCLRSGCVNSIRAMSNPRSEIRPRKYGYGSRSDRSTSTTFRS